MFLNRQGNLSVFKLGLLAGLIGVLVIGLGIFAFFADQNSRRAPLNIEPFPGAEPWGAPSGVTETTRNLFFRVYGARPDDVAAYYQTKLNEHTGDGGDRCVRIPPQGELPLDPFNPNSIPYQYVCLLDRSGMGSTQFTRVVIYPGVANPDPFFDAAGATVIKYEQEWQR